MRKATLLRLQADGEDQRDAQDRDRINARLKAISIRLKARSWERRSRMHFLTPLPIGPRTFRS